MSAGSRPHVNAGAMALKIQKPPLHEILINEGCGFVPLSQAFIEVFGFFFWQYFFRISSEFPPVAKGSTGAPSYVIAPFGSITTLSEPQSDITRLSGEGATFQKVKACLFAACLCDALFRNIILQTNGRLPANVAHLSFFDNISKILRPHS